MGPPPATEPGSGAERRSIMTLHLRSRRVALLVTLLIPTAVVAIQRSQSGSVATEKIFEALAIREGQTVCEIGAGDGELTIAARSEERRVGYGRGIRACTG